jgi:hypothetical protein
MSCYTEIFLINLNLNIFCYVLKNCLTKSSDVCFLQLTQYQCIYFYGIYQRLLVPYCVYLQRKLRVQI